MQFAVQDSLEYRCRMRLIRVRTLEGFVKVMSVDDSHTVLEVTKIVCGRIGTGVRDCVRTATI